MDGFIIITDGDNKNPSGAKLLDGRVGRKLTTIDFSGRKSTHLVTSSSQRVADWMFTYMAGPLNVSNMTWVMRSR